MQCFFNVFWLFYFTEISELNSEFSVSAWSTNQGLTGKTRITYFPKEELVVLTILGSNSDTGNKKKQKQKKTFFFFYYNSTYFK